MKKLLLAIITPLLLGGINGQTTKKLLTLRKPETKIKLNVNEFPSGMYMLSLVDNNNFVITKMVQIVK